MAAGNRMGRWPSATLCGRRQAQPQSPNPTWRKPRREDFLEQLVMAAAAARQRKDEKTITATGRPHTLMNQDEPLSDVNTSKSDEFAREERNQPSGDEKTLRMTKTNMTLSSPRDGIRIAYVRRDTNLDCRSRLRCVKSNISPEPRKLGHSIRTELPNKNALMVSQIRADQSKRPESPTEAMRTIRTPPASTMAFKQHDVRMAPRPSWGHKLFR